MSISGAIRGRPSVIQLTSEDIKISVKPRHDERPRRRRPLYTVVPGESDPIIAKHVADMIEVMSPYDDLIPALYQEYVPTVYGNDDEDRLISPLQRQWIHRCIVLGEYDYLPLYEMRTCLHSNFEEQALADRHALEQSSLFDLVDYFRRLAHEAQHALASKTDLELISKHHRVLWGHRFEVPGPILSFTGNRSSNDSSRTGSSSNRSSTGDVHASGLMNESRLAIAPYRPNHDLANNSRVVLPTQPSRVHLDFRGGAVARPQTVSLAQNGPRAVPNSAAVGRLPGSVNAPNPNTASQRQTAATHLAHPSRGSPTTLGRELSIRQPISSVTPQTHLPNNRSRNPNNTTSVNGPPRTARQLESPRRDLR